MVSPPSTRRTWPLTNAALSDRRKPTAWAMSSGVPSRPSGFCSASQARPASGTPRAAVVGQDEAGGDHVAADAVPAVAGGHVAAQLLDGGLDTP